MIALMFYRASAGFHEVLHLAAGTCEVVWLRVTAVES